MHGMGAWLWGSHRLVARTCLATTCLGLVIKGILYELKGRGGALEAWGDDAEVLKLVANFALLWCMHARSNDRNYVTTPRACRACPHVWRCVGCSEIAGTQVLA